jgi:hypothetical protein
MQRALELIQEHPFWAMGLDLSLALSTRGRFYQIEPVHRCAAAHGKRVGYSRDHLIMWIGSDSRQEASIEISRAIVYYSALIGLGATSLFDHYLWTLAPGRILLAAMLGLWEGQVRADELRG